MPNVVNKLAAECDVVKSVRSESLEERIETG
jgi:hypothetical protein